MEAKRPLIVFIAVFSCYLIFSLTLVSAYQAGGVFKERKASLAFEPVLKILDELEPVNCESSGYITFRAYVENVAEFDVSGAEASVHDIINDVYYNVSSSISCNPKAGLISNQEITCRLSVKELLSKLPSCPLENAQNKFYLTLELSYLDKKAEAADEKTLTISESGTQPSLAVDFAVSQPAYGVPEINCRTGSQIDVPVVISHAETLFGSLLWSFSVSGIQTGGIECEKMLSREGEGTEDIYLCTLVVPNTLFGTCEDGTEVTVAVQARTQAYNISDSFATTLVSQELDLSLQLSKISKLECQIIDEDGTCVPGKPQQNVTATITGNVPEKLSVFEARYRIGAGDITLTSCRKITGVRYQCPIFMPLEKLPLPAKKTDKSSRTIELAVFLDVKYLNYYRNVSAKTDVTLEGTLLSDVLNTTNVLEKNKGLLKWIQDNDVQGWIGKALWLADFISSCCLLTELLLQLTTGNLKEALNQLLKTYGWGPAEGTRNRIIAVITKYGPSVINCLADKGIKAIEKETQNLDKFEKGEITSKLQVPTINSLIDDYALQCVGQSFWDAVKPSWSKWLCAVMSFLALVVTQGAAAGVIGPICEAMESPAANLIKLSLNLLLMAITYYLMLETFNTSMKSIAIAREKINVQLEASNILAGYAEALQGTMSTLATEMASSAALQNITYPSYETVSIVFSSDRTGVLGTGDSICSGDMIGIDYNFEKLSQIEGFKSELSIQSATHAKLLHFEGLKGTYGPYAADMLLGTDPARDPPEPYTFTLRYADKKIDYTLNYVNHPCA